MRITFVLGDQTSGGARVVAMHARHLVGRGHEVVVFAPVGRPPSIKKGLRNLLRNGYWASPSSGNPLFAGLDFRQIDPREILSGSALPDADVLVATWWETAEWIHSAPPAKGTQIHFVQGHEVFEYLPVERVKAVYRLPIPKIVVSNWLGSVMRREYQADDVVLVPNAVDLNVFNAEPRGKQAVPTCGFVYSPTPTKGVQYCVEAIQQVKRVLPELRVVSFGAAPPSIPLLLPDWVEFSLNPPQSRIRDLYANCDAWLFPSISEGFGLPVLEAMACRTPVIGTAAGAGADYISETTGACVDGTAGSFVEQILRFAKMDDAQWRSRSEGARRRVTDYSWDDAGHLFESFLRRALEQLEDVH